MYFYFLVEGVMSRYEKESGEGRKFPIVMALIIIALIVLGGLFFIDMMDDKTEGDVVSENMTIPDEKPEFAIESENLLRAAEGEEVDGEPEIDEVSKYLEELTTETEKLSLEESDKSFKGAVGHVSEGLEQWFETKDALKKYTFLINDISQNQILTKNRKFLQPSQKLEVQKDAKGLYLDEKSYKRYDDFSQSIDKIDVKTGVGVYLAFKPLLNQVYKVFSYPDTYQLDDIFLKAAANVMKAPIIEDRIGLVKHSLIYKFEDKELEELGAVEKQMLRMGPENTKVIQNKLRLLVAAILAEKE